MTPADRFAVPEFAVVVRGYDRGQVDHYLGQLLDRLSETEQRLAIAENANAALRGEVAKLRDSAAALEQRSGVPGPQSLTVFGERLAQIMQSALAAAEELRAGAEREARERRDAAAAELQQAITRAEAESREILRRAEKKAQEMEQSIEALGERRAAAMEELGRLRRQLEDVLSAGGAASAGSAAEERRGPAGVSGATKEPGTKKPGDEQPVTKKPEDEQPVTKKPGDEQPVRRGEGGGAVGETDPVGSTRQLPVVDAELARGRVDTPEPTIQFPGHGPRRQGPR